MTAPMADATDRRLERRIAIVVALSVLVVVLIGLGTPTVLRTSNAAQEVRHGNDIASCRSAYAAAVTEKRTNFDIARSHRDTSAAIVNLTLLELAQAALFGDDATVDELQRQLPALRQEVREANESVAAADEALIDANDTYQAALEQSRSDPDAFLASCQEAPT